MNACAEDVFNVLVELAAVPEQLFPGARTLLSENVSVESLQ